MKWQPIETAPKDGTRFRAQRTDPPLRHDAYKRRIERTTWWGKASHVPLYGWCWQRRYRDFENTDLWEPTHWLSSSAKATESKA